MDFNNLFSQYDKRIKSLGFAPSDHVLLASIANQQLAHLHLGRRLKVYAMSSSKQPSSCLENSLGTPWGLHEVCDKIGDGEPLGMVFEGRNPIGLTAIKCSFEKQKKNLITSRILRLKGLEVGINSGGDVDTYNRFVYIHGTNHEENLGSPSSSGCLQLANQEIVDLFNRVDVGSHLYIENPTEIFN